MDNITETKFVGEEFTVNVKGIPRESTRAQGEDVHAVNILRETRSVALPTPGIGEEEVGPANGLGALKKRRRKGENLGGVIYYSKTWIEV